MTNTSKAHLIIHPFAIAHALVCLLLYDTSFGDGIVLTILTIAMIIVLVRSFGGPLDLMLGLLLLGCLAGFYLGTKGADLVQHCFPSMKSLYTHVITTALVTEILGWTLFLVVRRKQR